MTDTDLTRKHAIERFLNAQAERNFAEHDYNRAVAKQQKCFAALEEASKALVELCDVSIHTRYIRCGDKLLVVSKHGVEISALETD